MKPEERAAKILFGAVMISSFFIKNGKWLILALGILFWISAAWGICWTCRIKKILGIKPKINLIKSPGGTKGTRRET